MKCTNCQIVIRWLPTIVDGKAYCCAGCAHGGPCTCDYDHLPDWEEKRPIVLRRPQNISHHIKVEYQEENKCQR
jgi:hypothetical protein